MRRTANGDNAAVSSHVRGELCVAAGRFSSSAMVSDAGSASEHVDANGLPTAIHRLTRRSRISLRVGNDARGDGQTLGVRCEFEFVMQTR